MLRLSFLFHKENLTPSLNKILWKKAKYFCKGFILYHKFKGKLEQDGYKIIKIIKKNRWISDRIMNRIQVEFWIDIPKIQEQDIRINILRVSRKQYLQIFAKCYPGFLHNLRKQFKKHIGGIVSKFLVGSL